jgi:hypothetical protein
MNSEISLWMSGIAGWFLLQMLDNFRQNIVTYICICSVSFYKIKDSYFNLVGGSIYNEESGTFVKESLGNPWGIQYIAAPLPSASNFRKCDMDIVFVSELKDEVKWRKINTLRSDINVEPPLYISTAFRHMTLDSNNNNNENKASV